jgi:hypothetical protein
MMESRMKNLLQIVLVLGFLSVCVSAPAEDEESPAPYQTYSSTHDPKITMDYMTNWKTQETQGTNGSYVQIQFIGPPSHGFAPTMILTIEPEDKVAFDSKTVDQAANVFVQRRLYLPKAQVASSGPMLVQELPAVYFVLTYQKPDRLGKTDAKMIAFKERAVIFKKGNKFYTLRYVHQEPLFTDFEEDFNHVLASLKINE